LAPASQILSAKFGANIDTVQALKSPATSLKIAIPCC